MPFCTKNVRVGQSSLWNSFMLLDFGFFFGELCYFFMTVVIYECRHAHKTQINSVYFCTTKMLDAALSTKQLSLALTDFTAFRLYLAAGWYTCQSLLATTTLAVITPWLDSRWHWRGPLGVNRLHTGFFIAVWNATILQHLWFLGVRKIEIEDASHDEGSIYYDLC